MQKMSRQVVTAIFIAGLTVLTAPVAVAAQADAAPVVIHIVGINQAGSAVTLGGTVIPHRLVKLSAQIPGDVKSVAGSEGDAFKAGAALVQLDIAALLAKRKQALTQLASAQAGHHNAIVQYNREVVSPNGQSNSMMGGVPGMLKMFTDPMRSMSGQGSPGYDRHSDLVGQSTRVQTAANSVEQARQAIAELDTTIENATSRAPFDGVIVAKMVVVGDIVQPGMPLVTFADTSHMQIQVEVPTRLVAALQVGAMLKARLDNRSQLVSVRVDQVFPMAQAGGHTTTVKFGIPQDIAVQSGTYAAVLVPDTSHRSARPEPVVPQSAVVWRGSLPAVFEVMSGDVLKMKILRLGERTGDGQFKVISGIEAGTRILKNPTATTRSGPPN